jgi:RNA polymerase sigma factor (sigma-70 family)
MSEPHQPMGEQPGTMLALTTFQDTPWTRILGRAAEHHPDDATAIFDGLTGLYWAYGSQLPGARALEAPTKELLTQFVVQQHAGSGNRPDFARPQPQRLLDVANHLRSFVGMWVATQPEIQSRRSLRLVAEAMHTNAATQLDTVTYPQEVYNPSLSLVAQDLLQAGWEQAEATNIYRALTRHFTDDPSAPPVAVPGESLLRALTFMRARYQKITQLEGYQGNADDQRLMQTLLGADQQSQVRSVRELLLCADGPEQREQMLTAIAAELAAITNSDLVSKLAAQASSERLGLRELARIARAEREGESIGRGVLPPHVALSAEIEASTNLWALVRAAQAGGEGRQAALDKLYRATYRPVYFFMYSLTHDHEFSEEMTSRVYERVLKSIDQVEDRGVKVTAWMFTIGRNLVADHFKSHTYLREVLTDVSPSHLQASLPAQSNTAQHAPTSPWLGPEGAVMHDSGLRPILLDALRSMTSEMQVTCVTLRFLEQRSVEETAVLMGTTEGAVRALTLRAMSNLRTIISDKYPDLAETFL